MLMVVSVVVMLAPKFSDGNRIMMMCAFPLVAYLIFLGIKKTCIEIELLGDGVRLKTNIVERVLTWQQISEITIQRKRRKIKLKTEAGEFVLNKTYGRMEELMNHLEAQAAINRIALINQG